MGFYNETDIKVSPSGDLSVGANGDFILIATSGVLKQDITFRLRTDYNDFEPHPEVGADLIELIGEPNTRDTSKQGEAKIVHSLTYDGRVRNMDLYVRAVPIAQDKIVFYTFVNDGTEQLNVTPDVVFDMMNGLTNTPGV